MAGRKTVKKRAAKKKTAKRREEAMAHPLKINANRWDSVAIAEYVAGRISCSSDPVYKILNEPYLDEKGNAWPLPDNKTFSGWCQRDKEVERIFIMAKKAQMDFLAEEIMEIADNAEDTQKANLQINTRKWIMARLKPARYGDRVALQHDIEEGSPLAKLAEALQGSALPVADDE